MDWKQAWRVIDQTLIWIAVILMFALLAYADTLFGPPTW